MAHTEVVLGEQIAGDPAEVRAFYVDLDNIATVHPLVVDVESISQHPTPTGYRQTYRIRDRIPLGPLTVPIRYTARLTVPRNGDVIAESWQFPRVRLYTVVSFEAAGGGTALTERLRITAPRPLAGVTVRQAVAAHRDMLAGIRVLFSSRRGS